MALTIKIAASSNGVNEILAAATGFKYRVLAFVISFSGSVNAKWQSATTDTTGLFYGAAGVVVTSPALPPNVGAVPRPQFTTTAGEALNLNLSTGTAVGGYVVYEKVLASQ